MDLPLDPSLDVSSEEEKEEEPGQASMELHWNLDQGVEGSSLMEQPQPSWLDGQQAEPELRKLQLQQVSLEGPGEEHEQLLVVSKDEVWSTSLPDPRTYRAKRRQAQGRSARLLARRQSHASGPKKWALLENVSSSLFSVFDLCILNSCFGLWTDAGLCTGFVDWRCQKLLYHSSLTGGVWTAGFLSLFQIAYWQLWAMCDLFFLGPP